MPMPEQVSFPQDQFPSQDALEAAETMATDEYQRSVRRPGELSDWLDGSQENAKEVAEYLKSRPSIDSGNMVHHPRTNKRVDSQNYFEGRRGTHAASSNRSYEDMDTEELSAKIDDADTNGDRSTRDEITEVMKDKFKGMSTAQLAREMARADYREDDSIGNEAEETLRDKFDAEGERLGEKTKRYTEEEHDEAEDKRWDRMMKIYDREIARLEAKEEVDPGPSPSEEDDNVQPVAPESTWKSFKGRVKKMMSKAAEALLNGGVNRKTASAVVAGSVVAAHEVELPSDEDEPEAGQPDMTSEESHAGAPPAGIPEEEREVAHA